MSQAEEKLKALGLALPEIPVPVATYVPFGKGNMIYLSGQGPKKPDGSYHLGTVGQDVTTEEAYDHARRHRACISSAVAKMAAGSLDRVRVLKLFGMVKATPDFADHPKVINGCSDLFVAVLGDDGRHARSAVGMGSLPNSMTVEIECILALKD